MESQSNFDHTSPANSNSRKKRNENMSELLFFCIGIFERYNLFANGSLMTLLATFTTGIYSDVVQPSSLLKVLNISMLATVKSPFLYFLKEKLTVVLLVCFFYVLKVLLRIQIWNSFSYV